MAELQPQVDEVQTSVGPARVHLHLPASGASGLVLLGTSFSGGVTAPSLVLATDTAVDLGWAVALLEQPYRVAGRRGRIPLEEVDRAFVEVAGLLTREVPRLVTGGRSYGARTACRTAAETGAAGVVCLAFPLQPPGDRPSRQPELASVAVPTLVVQGDADPFGVPEATTTTEVVVVAGDHGLRKDHARIRTALSDWLAALPG